MTETEISFRLVRRESLSYNTPIFLDQNQSAKVEEVIHQLETSLGMPESEFEDEFIQEEFPDRKIARGLFYTLTRWFYNLRGIQYDSAGLHLDPWELRVRLFELMESEGLTWANYQRQQALVEKLADEVGVGSDVVKTILFADHTANFQVTRRLDKPPTAAEVIGHFNTDIIRYLLNHAYNIDIFLSGFKSTGQLTKRVFRNVKLWGLESEIVRLSDELVRFSIVGPSELVGRSTKYGRNLYSAFMNMVPLLRSHSVPEIFVNAQFYERRLQVLLPLEVFDSLLDPEEVIPSSSQPYDSKVEEHFAKQFEANFPQWELTREPVIVEDNLVMIPDFLARYRDIEFYIEIVGFWTERYLSKKVQKARLLGSKYQNLILIVDESLDFPEVPLPTFYYKKRFPLPQLQKLLHAYEENAFQQFVENLGQQKENWLPIIQTSLQDNPIVDEDALCNILGARSSKEAKIAVKTALAVEDLADLTCVCFSDKPLLVQVQYLKQLQERFTVAIPQPGVLFKDIIEQFSEVGVGNLRTFLLYLGYKFKVKTLLDEVVSPPRAMVEVQPRFV